MFPLWAVIKRPQAQKGKACASQADLQMRFLKGFWRSGRDLCADKKNKRGKRPQRVRSVLMREETKEGAMRAPPYSLEKDFLL
jgi:hypothetical protein